MIGLRYPLPLSLQDRALIDLVTTRFEGVEAPFIAFESQDGYLELHTPRSIQLSPERLSQLREQANASVIEAEAQDLHGLSNG